MARVVIVGGGITGLAAAHRIHRDHPDVEVVVLEAGERPGGLVSTTPFDGLAVDAAADAYADYAYATATYVADAEANAFADDARTRTLRNLCQTIALAIRDAVDAAVEGYERSQRTGALSMQQTNSISQ